MNLTKLLMLETAPAEQGSMLLTLLPLALLAIVFYFFLYRPQKKQEKETAEMRNSVELGDIIVTAGGIVGMVVKVTEEMLLIETSGNRTKIQIQKWAVQSVLEKANEPEAKEVKSVKADSGIKMKEKEDKAEKKEKKSLFGRKKDEDK
ncbi:MAG: preprotein translocase subunit YajC [Clostridia bacterium]|nr:preprotein translocase subunit YajC [Clostridia bacterium]MBR6783282.1 preprotein translocase subunit YajC [Clostridia bacterium]